MKKFSLFFIFITFHSLCSGLSLQSQPKSSGDVLSSSEWNSMIANLENSNKEVVESMLIGSWTCESKNMQGYNSVAGWTSKGNAPFTYYERTNYPITFSVGSPSTWSSSETLFWDESDTATNGNFFILNNQLYIAYSNEIKRGFTIRFHGGDKFTGFKNGVYSGNMRNFSCEKQS